MTECLDSVTRSDWCIRRLLNFFPVKYFTSEIKSITERSRGEKGTFAIKFVVLFRTEFMYLAMILIVEQYCMGEQDSLFMRFARVSH